VAVIQRVAGHGAPYLGDGLLVYFRYPRAHEDDAQRAVRTGLGILEAMGMLNTRLVRDKRVRLAVRLGIHTGLAVVGEMGSGGRQEHLACSPPRLAHTAAGTTKTAGERRTSATCYNEVTRVTPIYGGRRQARLVESGLVWPCPAADHPGTPILHTETFTRGRGLFHDGLSFCSCTSRIHEA
jgi:hypothetical protein